MTYIDYSAFDPTFMLHRAMIDRIFAMWQILNPTSFVVPEPAMYNTYTESVGQTQDINSPLRPFHQDIVGSFWTSASARSTEAFGYAYPETVQNTGINVTNQVSIAINSLYGPAATSPKTNSRRSESGHLQDSGSVHTEWIANIRVQKYALNAPFFVHIFVGSFNPDPFSWTFDPSLACTQAVFVKAASSIPTSCNCDVRDQMVAATIPLTDSLVDSIASGRLNSMDTNDVTAFLAENLKYRITLFNDMAVRNEDVPSLKVSVVSVDVEYPETDSELPVWRKIKGHMDVSMASG